MDVMIQTVIVSIRHNWCVIDLIRPHFAQPIEYILSIPFENCLLRHLLEILQKTTYTEVYRQLICTQHLFELERLDAMGTSPKWACLTPRFRSLEVWFEPIALLGDARAQYAMFREQEATAPVDEKWTWDQYITVIQGRVQTTWPLSPYWWCLWKVTRLTMLGSERFASCC